MMLNDNTSRWKLRHEHFQKALILLQEVVEDRGLENLTPLEQEGAVQRFEFTFELAWKTLKDYLVESGISFSEITPKSVIKESFAAGIISDGQVFIEMLNSQNQLSHTYDFDSFRSTLSEIKEKYYTALIDLNKFFCRDYKMTENLIGLSPALLQMIKDVMARHPKISRIVLFGSRARGNFRDNSDVDLAITGVKSADQLAKITADLDDLPTPYKFDLISLDTITESALITQINYEGIDL